MTNAMLNTQLFQKMYAEQERYKAYLLILQPEEILNRAREYISRENILLIMESNDLEAPQAKVLLKSPTPLADIYKKYSGWEHQRRKEEFWNTVEARSGEILRAEFAVSRSAER